MMMMNIEIRMRRRASPKLCLLLNCWPTLCLPQRCLNGQNLRLTYLPDSEMILKATERLTWHHGWLNRKYFHHLRLGMKLWETPISNFLSSRHTRHANPICPRERCSRKMFERKMFERPPWTWKSYIFSCSNKWCTILLVIMALGQILRLLDLVKVRIPRFTNRGDLNIFGGQTWRAIGFTEWVISYQCWPICACQIKVQGWTAFYGQATEWYWLNEWHWLNYSVVHLCRHSSGMSAAFKHLSEQMLYW